MRVRAARADDAEGMGAIFVAAAGAGWTAVFGPVALAALRPPARLRRLLVGTPERTALALEDAGALLGFAILRPCPDADGDGAGEVEMPYVHPPPGAGGPGGGSWRPPAPRSPGGRSRARCTGWPRSRRSSAA